MYLLYLNNIKSCLLDSFSLSEFRTVKPIYHIGEDKYLHCEVDKEIISYIDFNVCKWYHNIREYNAPITIGLLDLNYMRGFTACIYDNLLLKNNNKQIQIFSLQDDTDLVDNFQLKLFW